MMSQKVRASSAYGKEMQVSNFDTKRLVSIIIPSKNSERTIADCLKSIASQSYPEIEIIVVDASSTDLTRKIAQGLGARVISIEGERSVAKNLGAKFGNGKYLFFMDADHMIGPDVLATCVKEI